MPEFTFDTILHNLKNNVNFSYARYGDGEWNCILQKKPGGQNCDGHQYFDDLGLSLRRILESRPNYYLGLQRLATEQNEGNKEFDWLVALNKWTDNEIMHRASIKGKMRDFFDAILKRRVILVGNESLKNVPFKFDVFIEIPGKNCWEVYDNVRQAIAGEIECSDVILYCASMMSEVLIDAFSKCDVTQIDCGSVFDPYVGKQTRSYHKNLLIK